MKKLSMLAVLALVATGCDPWEDAPGGTPEVLQVTASGWFTDGPIMGHADATTPGLWVVEDAFPVDSNDNGEIDQAEIDAAKGLGIPGDINGAIVVTTNKLLNGATIQTAPADPSDVTDFGNCVPAGNWLTVTHNGAPEALNFPSDDPADPFQWFTCYYPGAATSSYGASIVIFRTYSSLAPTSATGRRPLITAFLDANSEYTLQGTVKDDSGKDLAINVRVKTGANSE